MPPPQHDAITTQQTPDRAVSFLSKIPTLARKARLYLEWNGAMFFPPNIALLRFIRRFEDSSDEVSQDQGAQGVTERSPTSVAERV